MRLYSKLLFILLFGFACNQPYTIKPKGYPQTQFPIKQYQSFSESAYPYAFDYPNYAVVDKDKNNWLNIRYPQFGATLYISYNTISTKTSIDKLVNDAYVFANNHNSKASFIEDSSFVVNDKVKGVFFHIGGDVATTYQFFATDSTNHFLRAALYFDTTPNEDSLTPANLFLFKDMQQMVRTLRWK